MKRTVIQLIALAAAMMWTPIPATAGEKKQNDSKLQISFNESGQIVITWNGKAVLAEARGKNGQFKRLHKTSSPYVVAPTEDGAAYRLEADTAGSTIYSINAVGYVNLRFPQGLTPFTNPLYQPDNAVALLLPPQMPVPDGSQLCKYMNSMGAYEVSTFDALTQSWSDPAFQLPMGEGVFFRNPSTNTVMATFVGEVAQGCLTNSLPEGYSMKGALVPQIATLSEHLIPGEIGDEIRIYKNDLQGGGTYDISVYTVDGWTPNLVLNIGEAFWIYKQNPQDWVRCFWVN
jgi:hypothetical protein